MMQQKFANMLHHAQQKLEQTKLFLKTFLQSIVLMKIKKSKQIKTILCHISLKPLNIMLKINLILKIGIKTRNANTTDLVKLCAFIRSLSLVLIV